MYIFVFEPDSWCAYGGSDGDSCGDDGNGKEGQPTGYSCGFFLCVYNV